MTRSSIKELVNYDPEIERSLRLRRKGQELSSQSIACEGMENQKVENINPREVPPPVQIEDQFDEVAPRPANRILRDYARPDRFNCESSIRKPPVASNNFEIRTGLIQTIQQSCIFTGDASEDPHSHLVDFLELVETAKYNGVPPEAIKLRLFPFSLKGDANTWLRSLPQGSITTWDQMTQKFLNKYFSPAKTTKLRQDISNFLQTDTESVYQAWERLKPSSRNVIDAAEGGSIMGKTTEEALQLLNEISENDIQWPSERIIIKKAATVNQVNTQKPSQSEACDMCGGNQQNHECQAINHNDEHVNVIGYKQYPFGSSMTQKHPGFQGAIQMVQRTLKAYRSNKYRIHPDTRIQTMVTDEKMEIQKSSLKNLEIQLSQLAALVSEKIQGPLPSNTEKNPKEHLKAITLRSGKDLDEPYVDQSEQQVNNGKNVEIPSEPSKKNEVKKKEEKNIEKLTPLPVTIPFPQKMKREKLDNQFAKFMEILKQIHINIHFTDALLQMPSYAKFLNLSSKRKLEEVFVVMLTKKFSAILQNKLPQKLGDPGSFTIPCTLRGVYFEKALCDSGASINLMPFSIFKKLDLGEIKDTSVSLQFVDQSTKKPKGIIENVLVRVDKFVFPVDFIVLEMKECPNEPIILGRPFLATGRAIIDVHQGQLILRVDEERVIFDMQKILRYSGDETSSSCFSIDMISYLTDELKDDQLISNSIERCLVKSGTTQDDDPTIRKKYWTKIQKKKR
ncbi:uncharacterized protein [Nicotiana sylvestris]|uniref:uncharacterized protein n=1 Tax=Nicotiana sylvestris TaxID=4096 RepID=UPI00388C4832